jgi:hypothetical protein
MENFLTQIISLKRSKNVMLFKQEEIDIINTFANLPSDGFMESTDLTKLGRFLERGVIALIKEKGLFETFKRVDFTPYLSAFKMDSFTRWNRKYNDENYEYYKFLRKEKTESDVKDIFEVTMFVTGIMPFVDRYFHVCEHQYMRNGVIPKKLVKTLTPKETIKGKLSVKFQDMVTNLANELAKNLENSMKSILDNKVKINCVTWDVDKKVYIDRKISESLMAISNQTSVDGFIYRLCDKLGGFEPKSEVESIKSHITNKNRFTVYVEFANKDRFVMKGNVVVNTSPLGNNFMQYPITFEVLPAGGELITGSEVNLKKYL